jgi:hypothetical protein
MKVRVLMNVDEYKYAEKMIYYGVRPPIVWTNFPRLNIRGLCALWKKIQKKPVPSGLMPSSVVSLLSTPLDCVQAHYFLKIYEDISTKNVSKSIDIPALISAYEIFVAIVSSSDINLTTAWYIARDYRIKILHKIICKKCKLEYLVHDQPRMKSKVLKDCPYGWSRQISKKNKTRKEKYANLIN